MNRFTFAFILILSMNSISINFYNKSVIDTRVKKAPCHEEYDYINSKKITVCGDWTDYPSTINAVPLNSDLYQSWFGKTTYNKKVDRITYKDTDGVKYPADIYLPDTISKDIVKAKITNITEPKDVSSITITHTITKSVETSVTHTGEISIGLTIQNKLKTLSLALGGGYSYSFVESEYYSKSKTISSTYENVYHNNYWLMEVLDYKAYIPVKIVMYKKFAPGSYIHKTDYFLYKVRDVAIRSWESHGFTDPWNVRGFVSGVDIFDDIITTHDVFY